MIEPLGEKSTSSLFVMKYFTNRRKSTAFSNLHFDSTVFFPALSYIRESQAKGYLSKKADPDHLFHWVTKSAAGGDVDAMYLLGVNFLCCSVDLAQTHTSLSRC